MTDYFVIGDVHGKSMTLNDLLQKWDEGFSAGLLGDLMIVGKIAELCFKERI